MWALFWKQVPDKRGCRPALHTSLLAVRLRALTRSSHSSAARLRALTPSSHSLAVRLRDLTRSSCSLASLAVRLRLAAAAGVRSPAANNGTRRLGS